MKLLEGNVFTPVCDSFWSQGVCSEVGVVKGMGCVVKGGLVKGGGRHTMEPEVDTPLIQRQTPPDAEEDTPGPKKS